MEYGHIFPYYNKNLLDTISPMTQTAGFIDIRSLKGYMNIGYPSEEQADWAASNPIVYRDTSLQMIRTCHHAQTLFVFQLANLPTHLLFKVLRQELINGLKPYGSDPEVIFDVSEGIKNLAGPSASVTRALFKGDNPSFIPT